ncbi:hypothetical protein GE061_013668 [Apolygus lucorum]|uniref:RHD domain-containing protein n=1 Tax=Apolygus lucorum TaxID=248454 RepID=A0A8S9XNC2_APOLU|nr:hypothetical protein GE061_013668 [Apolygus lucorum]
MWPSPVVIQQELHHSSEHMPVFVMQYDSNSNSNSSMEYNEGHQFLDLDAPSSASSGNYAMSPDSGYGGDEGAGVRSTGSGPYLTVVEEPETSYRFRYKKESQKPHGPLKGRESIGQTQKNSNGPRVKLVNFEGEAIIRCTLHCQTNEDGPSPHMLVIAKGKSNIEYEPFILQVNRSNDYTATFNKMNILHVVTKDEPYLRHYQLKKMRLGEPGTVITLPDVSKGPVELTESVQKEIRAHWRKINKDICKLRFEAFEKKGNKYHFIGYVLSAPIKNKKSPLTNDLRIVKSSHVEGPCTGGTEILIFTEKLIKDVQIIFSDEDGWEANADFKESDIHKQVAVAFKTPPYKDTKIMEPVSVFYKICRRTDGEGSNEAEFRYLPKEDNMFLNMLMDVPVKRKKPQAVCNNDVVLNDKMLSDARDVTTNDESMFLESFCSGVNNAEEYSTLSDLSTGDLVKDSLPIEMYGYTRDSIPTHQMGPELPDAKEAESLSEKARRLQSSIIKNDESAFAQLLATPHIVKFKWNNQMPLHCAVRCQKPNMVSKLLEANASIYELDSGSNTPLHLAIVSPSETCLQLLLQYAADCKAVFNKDGDDPVMFATRNDRKSALEMLLLKGFFPCTNNKKNGDTPLRVAVENCVKKSGNTEIVDLLLKYGACASEFNYAGETPLHVAAAAGDEELVQKLINFSDADDYEEDENVEDELSLKLQLLGLTDNQLIKEHLHNFLHPSDSPTEELTNGSPNQTTPQQTNDDVNPSSFDQLKSIEPFLALDGDVELSKKIATRLGCAFLIPFLVNSEKQSQLLLNHLQRNNDSSTAVALLNAALVKE